MRWAASSSAEASVLIDTRALARVLAFDAERGLITVEGGILWPALMEYLERVQRDRVELLEDPRDPRPVRQHPHWGIVQKQTGADRLSLGGALACNAHGRGLNLKPIVDQVESFDLRRCDRRRPDVLETRARGTLPPGDWRLRPLWDRHPRAAPPAPTLQGRARGHAGRDRRHHGPLRAADPGWLSLRRLSVRHRRYARQFSPPRRLLVLPARAARHSAHREPDAVPSGRLGKADPLLAHEQAPRV